MGPRPSPHNTSRARHRRSQPSSKSPLRVAVSHSARSADRGPAGATPAPLTFCAAGILPSQEHRGFCQAFPTPSGSPKVTSRPRLTPLFFRDKGLKGNDKSRRIFESSLARCQSWRSGPGLPPRRLQPGPFSSPLSYRSSVCVPLPRSCRPTASTATSIWCLKTSARAPVALGARPTRLTPISRRSCKISCPASTYPVRIVSFNAVEGWSRDATSEVVDALARRAADTDAEVPSALQDFIATNTTRRFDMQLPLPLRGLA
ncbi:hypothetical protein ABIB81_003077 [Bradyrhizobium sp. I1.7.5]